MLLQHKNIVLTALRCSNFSPTIRLYIIKKPPLMIVFQSVISLQKALLILVVGEQLLNKD